MTTKRLLLIFHFLYSGPSFGMSELRSEAIPQGSSRKMPAAMAACRLRLVAAMTRTSAEMGWLLPTRSNFDSSMLSRSPFLIRASADR
jgi:hypothetical protein